MDFDLRKVAVQTLKKNVGKTLESRPLRTELAAAGITLGAANDAKQTDTSQRWKFDVVFGGQAIPTRLEFSRRKKDQTFDVHQVAPPAPAILGAHQLAPFLFPHYLPAAAYQQKINALATRKHAQARDVFDLNLLTPHAKAGREAPQELVHQALEQLAMITPAMFRDQVVPFLPADLAGYYGSKDGWKQIKEQVQRDLTAALER